MQYVTKDKVITVTTLTDNEAKAVRLKIFVDLPGHDVVKLSEISIDRGIAPSLQRELLNQLNLLEFQYGAFFGSLTKDERKKVFHGLILAGDRICGHDFKVKALDKNSCTAIVSDRRLLQIGEKKMVMDNRLEMRKLSAQQEAAITYSYYMYPAGGGENRKALLHTDGYVVLDVSYKTIQPLALDENGNLAMPILTIEEHLKQNQAAIDARAKLEFELAQ